jgi:hypothetical protein
MSPIDKATLERMALKTMKVPDGTPCPRCGYELTGLDPQGRCPECGSPVELALRPDYLVYTSPEYVAKLHTGAFLVVLSMVITILTVLATMLFAVSGLWRGGGADVLGTLAGFAIGILSLTGWWLLSSPDPAKTSIDRGATSRTVLRGLLVIQVGAALINLVVELTGMVFAAGSAIALMNIIEQIVSYAAFITSMLYLRTLAWRMPSQHIADRAKVLLTFAIVLLVLTIVFFFGAALAAGIGGAMGGGIALAGCLIIPLAIAAIVFFVMYLFLLDRTRRTLKEIRERQ